MTISAKFEDGVFKPLEEVKLAEGTQVKVQVPEPEPTTPMPRKSLRDSPVFGMWADREDMVDSVAWVNRLRGGRD